MEFEDLEPVLSRVAELVDTKKSDIIRAFADEDAPSTYLRELSKGELIAEVVYYEIYGHMRHRMTWYE